MKTVRFTGENSTFVALGVGGAVEARGPFGLRVNGGPMIETAQFLRASAVKLFNRGNNRYSAQFGVWRQHATIEQAEDYLITHPGELPTANGLVCEIELNAGRKVYLSTPFIEIVDSSIRGLRTEHTYRLLGGAIVGSNPNT